MRNESSAKQGRAITSTTGGNDNDTRRVARMATRSLWFGQFRTPPFPWMLASGMDKPRDLLGLSSPGGGRSTCLRLDPAFDLVIRDFAALKLLNEYQHRRTEQEESLSTGSVALAGSSGVETSQGKMPHDDHGGIPRDALVRAGDSMSSESLCIVCEERPKDTVFQCGHRYCGQCAYQVSVCPYCREEVAIRIRIYN